MTLSEEVFWIFKMSFEILEEFFVWGEVSLGLVLFFFWGFLRLASFLFLEGFGIRREWKRFFFFRFVYCR